MEAGPDCHPLDARHLQHPLKEPPGEENPSELSHVQCCPFPSQCTQPWGVRGAESKSVENRLMERRRDGARKEGGSGERRWRETGRKVIRDVQAES